jgi:hypothetical protein
MKKIIAVFAVVFMAVVSVYPQGCNPAPAGLVAWWQAEGNANDSIGGNNGTPTGGITYTDGEVGQAFDFDGTGYIPVPASPSLDVGANGSGITIECWIKPAANVNAPVIEWDSAASDGLQLWVANNNTLLFANIEDTSGNPHTISFPYIFDTNNFQHVAVTYDKGSGLVALYLNGTAVATNNFGSITPQTSYPAYQLNIGRRTGQPVGLNDTYGGLIDELSVYSRALSSSEIAAIYGAGSSGKCPSQTSSCITPPSGLISWWQAEGNAYDSIGTNNGVLEGGLGFAPGEVGHAFNFISTNADVFVPAGSQLDVGKGAGFTLEAWINPTDVTLMHPIFEWNNLTMWGVHFHIAPGQPFNVNPGPGELYANIVDSSGGWHQMSSTMGVVTTNVFQHVALTYDKASGVATIYCNGQIVSQQTVGSFTPLTSRDMYLGRRPPTTDDPGDLGAFAGLMDEPTIYNRALSSNEIAAIYNAGSAGKCFTPVPPVITAQPQSQTNAIGGSANFSVAVSGTAPMSYHWSFNGTNILNATNVSLTLTNLQLNQAGNYSVLVTNVAGSTNSAAAVLTVVGVPPTIATQPTNQTVQIGGTASFNVTTTGTAPLIYQWNFNGTNIVGATNATLTVTNVQSSQTGSYAVSVTNVYGSTVSSNAVLSAVATLDHFVWNTIASPQYTNQPFGATITAKNIYNFTVTNFTGAVSLQASSTGSPTNSALILNGGFETGTLTNWTQVKSTTGQFVINNGTVIPPGASGALAPYAGSYSALGDENGPGIFYMYQDVTIPAGVSSATLSWAHCVRNYYSSFNSGQAFQVRICDTNNNVLATAFTTSPGNTLLGGWVQTNYNVTAFAGTKVRVMFWVDSTSFYIDAYVDNVSLQLAGGLSVTPASTGNFAGCVWNGSITVPQSATNVVLTANDGSNHTGSSNPFNVVTPTNPPVITTQPTNQTVNVGQTAVFNVIAGGTAPLNYQWKFGGTNILNATNSSLTLTNVQLSQAGNYSVLVTNIAGSTNSANAVLTVNVPVTCTPSPSGLISWWPGEGNGNDIIGTNNATVPAGVTYAAGEVGQAFNFNGTTTLTVADAPSLDPTNLTIECWIYVRGKVNNIWSQQVFTKDGATSARQYMLTVGDSPTTIGSGDLRAGIGVPSGLQILDSLAVIQSNTWYHVAETYDGAALKLYVNGSFDSQMAVTGPVITTTQPVRIGGDAPAGPYYFNGLVDEASIYNRALSSSEIAAIYNAGSAGKCFTPVPPVITTQPQSQTNIIGGTANFSVAASGTAPLSYQWSFNTANIAGATNTTLTLSNVQLNQAGNYSVLVSNIAGSTNSENAVLTVNVPTTIPAIYSFNPISGNVGTMVNIIGTNFSSIAASNIVFFGAVQASVVTASTTNLLVTVPVGATFAPITVTVNGLTACASQQFMPTFAGNGSGIGASSFGSRLDLPAGNGPIRVVIADIDGDGKPDLIVASGSGEVVSIYRNISTNGSLTAGSFAPRVDLAAALSSASPFDVEVADVDGDGKLDIVVSDFGTAQVSVYRNNCTPGNINSNLFTRVDFQVGTNPETIAIKDIDGDGKPDLLVANPSSGTISILRNTSVVGSLTINSFAPKVDIATGGTCDTVAVGDLDGDGKPDMVVGYSNNSNVSLFRNISSPGSITTNSFAPAVNLPGVNYTINLAIADLDGDGKLDLVAITYLSQTLSVFRNTSTVGSLTTNSFAPRIDYSLGGRGHSLAVGDLDGDGKPDIAAVTELNSLLSVFRNVSTPGSFTNSSLAGPFNFSTGVNAVGVSIGDLDGDGRPDVVFCNANDNTISIYQNTVPFAGLVITTQPTNQTVMAGGTATFSVTASGTAPLGYQWIFGGTNILNATNAILTLTNVQLSQAGNYSVTVSNIVGSTNSANAVLTVNVPVCDPPPSGLVAWWQAEGNGFDSIGTNNATVPASVTYTNGEVGQCFNFNGTANLTVADAPSLNPTNALTIECWVNVSGLDSLGKWDQHILSKDGETSARQYLLTVGSSPTAIGAGDFRACIGVPSGFVYFDSATVVQTNTWYHLAETYDGTTLKLYVNGSLDTQMAVAGPIITTTQPVRIGGLAYYFNGLIDEPSIYSRALSASEIQAIYNAGSAGKCFTPVAPAITTQPTNQTSLVGGTATFSVAASGTAPLGYQWSLNGTNITGATNPTLTLNNVQLTQAGSYSVVVTNIAGSTNSASAVLTVVLPPVITQQPQSQSVSSYNSASFTVSATGTGPLSYQWRKNGTNLVDGGNVSGSATTNLVLTNVSLSDTGNYDVIVGNPYATTNSTVAVLTVPQTVLTLVSTNAMSGTTVVVPVLMNAVGAENLVQASVGYDPTKLVLQSVQPGPAVVGAYFQEVDTQTNNGYVGFVILLSTGSTQPAGTNEEVADLVFSTLPVTNNVPVNLTFRDNPIVRGVVDNKANSLPAIYQNGTLTLAPAEYEADVSPRPTGDHQVGPSDWVEEGRMVAGLDTPTNSDEMLRADCAPRNAPDGVLTVADWVQAGRYELGLDPLTLVTLPPAPAIASLAKSMPMGLPSPTRTLQVGTVSVGRGQTVSVPVLLVCTTNENAVGMTIDYDASRLKFLNATLGSATVVGGIINVNTNHGPGEVGVALAMSPGLALAAGTNQVAVLQFASMTNASGPVTLSLDGTVVKLQLADNTANVLAASYVNGAVNLPPQPVVATAISDANLQLTWQIASGTFQVESASNPTGPWITNTTSPLSFVTNGANVTVTVTVTNSQQYYRLVGQ